MADNYVELFTGYEISRDTKFRHIVKGLGSDSRNIARWVFELGNRLAGRIVDFTYHRKDHPVGYGLHHNIAVGVYSTIFVTKNYRDDRRISAAMASGMVHDINKGDRDHAAEAADVVEKWLVDEKDIPEARDIANDVFVVVRLHDAYKELREVEMQIRRYFDELRRPDITYRDPADIFKLLNKQRRRRLKGGDRKRVLNLLEAQYLADMWDRTDAIRAATVSYNMVNRLGLFANVPRDRGFNSVGEVLRAKWTDVMPEEFIPADEYQRSHTQQGDLALRQELLEERGINEFHKTAFMMDSEREANIRKRKEEGMQKISLEYSKVLGREETGAKTIADK